MKNYRVGYATGRVVREIRKGAKRLGEVVEDVKKHVARKEAAKVQAGKDKIQKSEMGYAEGGRAGHALGHTAGRLTKTLERVGGGPEGKPHSTKKGRIAAGVRRIKRGAKSWNKKLNKMAKDAHLGRPFMKLEKPKKKKDYVIDPDETFGGRRIQKKGGPELIPPKRKDDVGVGGYQEPLKNIKRPAGLGAALRGGGRAFVKGGKV